MEYWVESPLNPNRLEVEEKEVFAIGRAAHHVFLGEEDFDLHFSVRPDEWDSWRTKDAKAWRVDETARGKTVLDPGQIEQIRGMAGLLPWQKDLEDSGLKNSAMVRGGILNGKIEHSVVWKDPETGIWIKSRPDAIPEDDGVNADLKTTVAVDYESLRRSAMDNLRYDMQAALARMGMRQVCGIDLTNFALVFVMKKPPHAVRIVEIKTAAMDEAEKDIRTALRVFAHCLEKKRWPGPGGMESDAEYIEMSAWGRKNADFRREFLEREIKAA